jgi:thiamine biosynthesis lipoprotein ApbE
MAMNLLSTTIPTIVAIGVTGSINTRRFEMVTRIKSKVRGVMSMDKTRAEIIREITGKVKRAKPVVKIPFLKSLRYEKKSELSRINRVVKVDRNGYGIQLF